MLDRTLVFILRLVLLSALVVTIPCGYAAKRPAAKKSTIDGAGRTHIRPARRISDSQRKAAAHLRKVMRANSARPVHKTGGQK
jgi:hypothetical protein